MDVRRPPFAVKTPITYSRKTQKQSQRGRQPPAQNARNSRRNSLSPSSEVPETPYPLSPTSHNRHTNSQRHLVPQSSWADAQGSVHVEPIKTTDGLRQTRRDRERRIVTDSSSETERPVEEHIPASRSVIRTQPPVKRRLPVHELILIPADDEYDSVETPTPQENGISNDIDKSARGKNRTKTRRQKKTPSQQLLPVSSLRRTFKTSTSPSRRRARSRRNWSTLGNDGFAASELRFRSRKKKRQGREYVSEHVPHPTGRLIVATGQLPDISFPTEKELIEGRYRKQEEARRSRVPRAGRTYKLSHYSSELSEVY